MITIYADDYFIIESCSLCKNRGKMNVGYCWEGVSLDYKEFESNSKVLILGREVAL